MDKEKLREELEKKRKELEELEKAMDALEEKKVVEIENNFDSSEIFKEIKGFPRYCINKKGEIYHEDGLPIIAKSDNKVELFDNYNNKVLVDINELVKNNF